MLLQRGGVNPDVAAHDGVTPLHWAVVSRHTQCVRLVLVLVLLVLLFAHFFFSQ